MRGKSFPFSSNTNTQTDMRLPNQIIHRSISTTQQLLYKDYYLTKGLGGK